MGRIADCDGMPSLERADDDRVVSPIRGETCIAGERSRSPQVDAAIRRVPPQEIGLHLHITVTQQQHVDPVPQRTGAAQTARCFHRPVGM